jgi:hypothetical protein
MSTDALAVYDSRPYYYIILLSRSFLHLSSLHKAKYDFVEANGAHLCHPEGDRNAARGSSDRSEGDLTS